MSGGRNWLTVVMLGVVCWVASVTAQSEGAAGGNNLDDHHDDYVGASVCAECHQQQAQLWQGSHHHKAMQLASENSVLGSFDGAALKHFDVTYRFLKDGDRFLIETVVDSDSDSDGEQPERYDVVYTFGVYPLQQYLVRLADGRYQVPTVAWDSRPKVEGGQRWFHLYPEESLDQQHLLHWKGSYFNWNSRCASCHSTALSKNYDAEQDRYTTTWSDINVACEACHGPGREHVQWARSESGNEPKPSLWAVDAVGQWLRQSDADTATFDGAITTDLSAQVGMCGACHARREELGNSQPLADFHQRFRLQELTEPLYYRDGQIRDEVFVLGSFLQSKMYHQGVVCSNCHEPHSLSLRAEGNGLCAQCHNPDVFDHRRHHHHPVGAGSQCINCHMPETTYMQVDPRRDHSIRIPRPDLSLQSDTPNACVQCHNMKTNQWAAEALAEWLSESGKTLPSPTEAGFVSTSDIVRASMLTRQRSNVSAEAMATAIKQLRDSNPLVRAAATQVVAQLPLLQRRPYLLARLKDPERSVRLTAMSGLLAVNVERLSDANADVFHRVKREYDAYLAHNADTPEGQLAIAQAHRDQGNLDAAERAYRRALSQAPALPAAALNLADLYREMGDDDRGRAVLQEALRLSPDSGELYFSIGLLEARQKHYAAAVAQLAEAHRLQPDHAHWGYVYAVSLYATGDQAGAIELLQQLHERHERNREILTALVGYLHRAKQQDLLRFYGQRLLALEPNNLPLRQLLQSLK